MKTRIISFTLLLGSICGGLNAQWNWTTPISNRWAQTNNPGGTANDIRSVCVGDYSGFGGTPGAYFNVNQFYLTQSISYAPGQMLRTDANAANFSAWRMFTGATAATTNEKFSLVVPALSNNVIQQSSRGDMYFNTAGAAPFFVTQERVHITQGFGNQIGVQQPNATKVNISYGANYAPIANPIAMLNLGLDAPTGPTGGQRKWMDVGTFMCASSDNMYVGLKNEDPGGAFPPGPADRMDAVINWGDNVANPTPFGPDNFRFIFTQLQNPATATGPASTNGLEAMRISPFSLTAFSTVMYTGIGGDPQVNLYGPLQNSINPTQTLEVNSSGATTVAGGSSGLRFTNLNASSPNTPNVASGNVLSVNANGDVILVPGGSANALVGAHNGTTVSTLTPNFVAFGQNIAQPGNPGQLLSNREIPQNGFNIQYIDLAAPVVGTNRTSYGQPIPLVLSTKFYVFNNIERIGGSFEMDATNVPFPATTLIENSFAARIFSLNNPSVTGIGVTGNSNNLISKANIGVSGSAFNGNAENIGVFGNVPLGSTSSGTAINYGGFFSAIGAGTENVGVYAEAANGSALNYAAIFQGDVLFNGNLSGINNVITSDQMFKTNIDTISNALGLIEQLQPKTYFLDTNNIYGMRFGSQRQYGLIAQDVMTILPELVNITTKPAIYDSTNQVLNPAVTYKTLNYNAFIAILIRGMQQQNITIDSLRTQMNTCCASNARTQNPQANQTDVTLTNAVSIVLEQNVPNPFAEQTTINYSLTQDVVKAQILFYDAQGKLIKAVDLENRGVGQLNVFANDLSTGIYTYALVADGKIIDTKKMVKTN